MRQLIATQVFGVGAKEEPPSDPAAPDEPKEEFAESSGSEGVLDLDDTEGSGEAKDEPSSRVEEADDPQEEEQQGWSQKKLRTEENVTWSEEQWTEAEWSEWLGSGASSSNVANPPEVASIDDNDEKMRLYYAAEAAVAKQLGLKWQERGPKGGPNKGGPPTWRHQNWREGSQRYANRGGRYSAWPAAKFNAIKAGLSEQDAIAEANMKLGKGQSKGHER